jgi:hypothetical protein
MQKGNGASELWWIHCYWWLENNNLWKSVVSWGTGLLLNAVWAIRLWVASKHRQKEQHAQILDGLDVHTPGGLGELLRLIKGGEAEGDDPDPHVQQSARDDDDRKPHSPLGHGILGPRAGGSGGSHH